MWGRVLSSIAKAALCPWLSYSGNYNMDQHSAHTLSLIMYTSECPKKLHTLLLYPKGFSTHRHLLLIWLHLFTEFNYFQQVVHK